MTIFVVALFLPYTISFDKTTDGNARTSSPPAAKPVIVIPKTPGATTDLEHVFVPEDRPFRPCLPTSKSLTRLSALAHRPDGHSPGWGKNLNWTQPESRAKSPPPSSILHHNVLRMRTLEGLLNPITKRKTRHSSSEYLFEDNNYTIEPSNISNGGLVVALDAATENGLLADKTWVGTLGMPTNALKDNVRSSIEEKLELEYDSLTIWADDDDLNGHYEHYCKTILWPHLHYQIPDHPKSKAYEDHSWHFYVKVNQTFADRIIKNWKKSDTIWIHDYHLMLVPQMIREKIPDAEIGFYMHAAFPSSEIFRCLATRSNLIEGLLGANLVGFQVEEYVHHFLQTCSRLLNVEATKHGIIMDDGRYVHVDAFPVGVDPEILETRRQEPSVKEWVDVIAKKYKGKKLIVARDKLDSIRGVRQKLLAYERLLERCPEYRDKVVLIQIATTAQQDPELDKLISGTISRINSRYSSLAHQPLVFLRQDIDYSQWLALLTLAECLVITSLREGMNLTGHEFILCQDGSFGEARFGPLVLSEFTGAATVFKEDSLLVNPWDITKCAKLLEQALNMNFVEKERRWKRLRDKVLKYCATNWYEQYIRALDHAYVEHSVRDATSVPRLSHVELKNAYGKASKRLIILDYEGTLATWGSPSDTVAPTPKRAIDILNDLIDDKNNTVYVMSGRGTVELESIFKHVAGLGLIAENGAYLRECHSEEWHCFCDVEHVESWMGGVRSILEYYQERMRGSKIEEFDTSVVLKYDEAEDTDMAFTQCGECASHISDVCARQEVHAVPIEQGICVSNIDVNKSSATERIGKKLLQAYKDGSPLPDFLLVIGDSREDEYVFDWAQAMKQEGIQDVITVSVGLRSTAASATIAQGVVGVLSALQKMIPAPTVAIDVVDMSASVVV